MADVSRHRPSEISRFEPPSSGDKFSRASKDNPAMVIGIGVGASVLGYMAWGLRTRKEKLSVYLIHTRLGVQGSIIGALSVAMTYQIYT
jgi:hypothetical protein